MAGSLTQIELTGIRVDQEAELDALCTIWRVTDAGTINKTTAVYSSPATTTICTDEPCSFTPIVSRRDRFDVHGEQQVYQNQYRVLLRWDLTGIRIGDLIRITTSEDGDLGSKVMTVKDNLLVSDTTLRRLTCIDIDE